MNKTDYFNNIKTFKFLANKSLGQNFLIVPEIAESIVDYLDINENDDVLEIGAGLGSLSYFLVNKTKNLTLIDVDERMICHLNENFKGVKIKRENILKAVLNNYSKIIGNLPYYITSGILEYVLLNGINLEKCVFMVQKEVLQKLNDKKEVSPLSLFLKYVSSLIIGKTVNRNCFTPVPHVDSAYFVLNINENIKNPDNKALMALMNKMFVHRRKTILNCLNAILNDKEKSESILNGCCLDASKRPEQLDINDYINLLNMLKSNDFISKII